MRRSGPGRAPGRRTSAYVRDQGSATTFRSVLRRAYASRSGSEVRTTEAPRSSASRGSPVDGASASAGPLESAGTASAGSDSTAGTVGEGCSSSTTSRRRSSGMIQRTPADWSVAAAAESRQSAAISPASGADSARTRVQIRPDTSALQDLAAPGLGFPRQSSRTGGNAHWRRTMAESREVCAARVIAPESPTLSPATMHSERRVGGGAGLGWRRCRRRRATGHDQERGKRPANGPSQGRTIGVVGHGRILALTAAAGSGAGELGQGLATTNGLPPMRLLMRLTAVWASSRVAKVPARTL